MATLRSAPRWVILAVAPLLTVLGAGLAGSTPAGVADVVPEPVVTAVAVPEVGPVAIDPVPRSAISEQAEAPPAVAFEDAVPPPPAPAPDPCGAALDWVAGAGLRLPNGVGYHCPSTEYAHQGAACWTTVCSSAYIAINMDRLVGATPEYLRHVVAHEICHILDWQSKGWTTEAGADACAAASGAAA